jgi:hypothetical protein
LQLGYQDHALATCTPGGTACIMVGRLVGGKQHSLQVSKFEQELAWHVKHLVIRTDYGRDYGMRM